MSHAAPELVVDVDDNQSSRFSSQISSELQLAYPEDSRGTLYLCRRRSVVGTRRNGNDQVPRRRREKVVLLSPGA